jgi:hypothetical protein
MEDNGRQTPDDNHARQETMEDNGRQTPDDNHARQETMEYNGRQTPDDNPARQATMEESTEAPTTSIENQAHEIIASFRSAKTQETIRFYQKKKQHILFSKSTVLLFAKTIAENLGRKGRIFSILELIADQNGFEAPRSWHRVREAQQAYLYKKHSDYKLVTASMISIGEKFYRVEDLKILFTALEKANEMNEDKLLLQALIYKWCHFYIENDVFSKEEFLGRISEISSLIGDTLATKNMLLAALKQALINGPKIVMVLKMLYTWVPFEFLKKIKMLYAIQKCHSELLKEVFLPCVERLRSLNPNHESVENDFFESLHFDEMACLYLNVPCTWHETLDVELANSMTITRDTYERLEARFIQQKVELATIYANVAVWDLNLDMTSGEQNDQIAVQEFEDIDSGFSDIVE